MFMFPPQTLKYRTDDRTLCVWTPDEWRGWGVGGRGDGIVIHRNRRERNRI